MNYLKSYKDITFEKMGYNESFDDMMTHLIYQTIENSRIKELFDIPHERALKNKNYYDIICYTKDLNLISQNNYSKDFDIKNYVPKINKPGYNLKGFYIRVYRQDIKLLKMSIDMGRLETPVYHFYTNAKTYNEFITQIKSKWGVMCISHENGHLYNYIVAEDKMIPEKDINNEYKSISLFANDLYRLLPNDYPNKDFIIQSIYWTDFRERQANNFVSGKLGNILKIDEIEENWNPMKLMKKMSEMSKEDFLKYFKEDIPKLLDDKQNYLITLDKLVSKYFKNYNKFYQIINKMSKLSYRKMSKNSY